MKENLIQQIIQQAKSKLIVFDNLTAPEQQEIINFTKEITQLNKIDFLIEDLILCINKSKGCPGCCATLINERIDMFRKSGGRSQWYLLQALLNDEI